MQTITAEVGVIDERGVVTLTICGRQLIRAMLLKWIGDCESGRVAARDMRLASSGRIGTGQEDYFRAAASKLGQIMACQVQERVALGPQLAIVAGWCDDVDLPYAWMQDIITQHEPEEASVTARSAERGGRVVGERLRGPGSRKAGRGKGKAD